MKKRDFLKTGTLLTLGTMVAPFSSCTSGTQQEPAADSNARKASEPSFTLPDLPYAHDALEPHIDAQTMGIHHGKHHAGYVKKLNAALEGHAMLGKELTAIVRSATDSSEDSGIRNNGGGHFNHSLFWRIMKPGGGTSPTGPLADAIHSTFQSFDSFKSEFARAAATRFGSGWAWLSVDGKGKLFVSSTPNQDNPMMARLVAQTGSPILGLDVWEHAYYLKYQNRRKEYIDNFFQLINWEAVAANYAKLG